MICRNPYVNNFIAYPCGQCHKCRITRRRILTHRILLESFSHKFSSFVTVTYDDGCIPKGGTLVVSDIQKWLKRLRKAVHPLKIRHYYCGEYGDGLRPHYHAAIFGLKGCDYPLQTKFARAKCKCPPCDLIRTTWGKGRTDCAYLELESAQYLAGYILKKLTSPDDDKLLRMDPDTLEWYSVKPEFAKWSQGLGKQFLSVIPETLSGYLPDDDVPSVLQHGPKKLPLGRYLRMKLRGLYGMDEKAPKEALTRYAQKMQELLEEAATTEIFATTRIGFKKFLKERSEQHILNLEQQSKTFQKGSL